MNQSQLFFLTILIALGLGTGFGLLQRYGLFGFCIGFLGSFVFMFCILIFVRKIAPKSNKINKKIDSKK